MKEILSVLNWLVESGADEALVTEPINRLMIQPSTLSQRPAEIQKPPAPIKAAPPSAQEDPVGAAQAAAAAAKTLLELQSAMEAFEGCPLKRNATHTVFGDGVAEAGVMFIGEAPGREEDRLGRPFVGRAGQLLDKMLASIGLNRRTNAYITNVINWRPPDNRDPSLEEAAMCLPFLRRHIELAQPMIIILLGAVAARHVSGLSEGILKIRGRWRQYRVGDSMVPLMATLHPAYLLRQPTHKKLAWRDLQSVREKLKALGLPRSDLQGN